MTAILTKISNNKPVLWPQPQICFQQCVVGWFLFRNLMWLPLFCLFSLDGAMSLLGLMCCHHLSTVVKIGWALLIFSLSHNVCIVTQLAYFLHWLFFPAIDSQQKNKNNNQPVCWCPCFSRQQCCGTSWLRGDMHPRMLVDFVCIKQIIPWQSAACIEEK